MGTFVTGNTQWGAPKTDAHRATSATDELDAIDINGLRDAADDLRDYTAGWVNPKSTAYGAKMDGTADDSVAMGLAIADAVTKGVGLLIPGKVRLASGALTVSVPVHCLGGGSFDLQPGSTLTLNGAISAAPSQRVFFLNGGTLSLGDKNSTVWVRWFGAVGDGSTNDTSSIQGAITALPSSGGVIEFNNGQYVWTTLTLDGTKAIWLRAQGWGANSSGAGGAVLKHSGTGDGIVVGDTSNDRTVDIRILGLRLQGNGTETGVGVKLQRMHHVYLEGNRIWGWGSHGIQLDRAYANKFVRNYVNNNGGSGFRSNQNSDFTIIEGNAFLANTAKAIYFDSGSCPGSRIINNDIEGNGVGIQIDVGSGSNAESVFICGNYFENQTGKNISLGEDAGSSWIDSVAILGNQVNPGSVSAATNSIALGRVRRPVVIGNTFNSANLTVTTDTSTGTLFGNTWNSSSFPTGAWARLDLSDANITRIWGVGPRIELQSAGWDVRNHVGLSWSGDVLEIGANIKPISATQGNLYDPGEGGSVIRVSPAYGMEFFTAPASGTNPVNLVRVGQFGAPGYETSGKATLVAGVATVNTAAIHTGMHVVCTPNTPGGNLGIPCVKDADIVDGTSFIIRSFQPGGTTAQTSDTSTVNWRIEG